MGKSFKKIVSVLLVVVMLLCSAPLQGFVELEWPELNLPDFSGWFSSKVEATATTEGTCGENATWSFDSSTGVLTISGSGAIKNYNSAISTPWNSYRSSIIEVVIGDGITSIGDNSFAVFSSLTKITIPDSVTSIGDYAFEYCTILTSVTIPNGVTSIGCYTFRDCTNLTSIVIPDGVTSIDLFTFYNCKSLKSVIIPDSVTSIGESAFSRCYDLTSIIIPESVTLIESYAFAGCSLTSITFLVGSKLTICDEAFNCYELVDVYARNMEEWLRIKFTDNRSNPMYYAENLYFDGVLAEDIVIPNKVTALNAFTFFGCECLKSVKIPDSVTSIGVSAFDSCTGLTKITIPDSLTYIGYAGFRGCTKLVSLTIPDSITYIDYRTFADCTALTSITIPNSVTAIGESVFSGCVGLTDITIPDSVNKIGSGAFRGCTGLTSITIPDSVVFIDKELFYGCTGLTSVTIPNSVTTIGNYAFSNCTSLTSITIPDSVTSIGDYAFRSCNGFTSLTIPESVTSIGFNSFYGCDSLMGIEVDEKNNYYSNDESGVLFDKNKTIVLLYPKGNTRTSYTLPESITTVGRFAFGFCSYIESLTIPKYITTIEQYAFHNCTNLNAVYYLGSEVQWGKVNIESYNSSLTDLKITFMECSHYNTTVDEGINATCLNTGISSGVFCNDCETWIEGHKTIAALGHDYSTEWTVDIEETCTKDGSKSYHCSRCDSKADISVIPAHGHDWSEWDEIKAPTCTKEGTERKTCLICEVTADQVIEVLGHDYSTEWIVDKKETCTEDGSKSHHCSRCSSKADVTVIPAYGHNYSSVTTAPTCEKQGYDTFTCANCGDVYKDNYVSALGHCYSSTVIEVTCTKDGYTKHTCSRCSDTYKDSYVTATGHKFGEWIKTKDPTCTKTGTNIRTCGDCNSTEKETIAALGHSWGEWKTIKEATVLCEGSKARTCSVCSTTETVATEKVQVDIENTDDYGVAYFTVVNAQTLEPIEGVSIFISTETEGETTLTTDAEGKADVILPVGKQTASAYAADCLTRNLKININPGVNEIPLIGLSSMKTYDATLSGELMTDEEIEEAGIDVSEEDNNHVYEYELTLNYGAEIDWASISFYFGKNTGKVYGGSDKKDEGGAIVTWEPDGNGNPRAVVETEEETLTIYPVTEYFYLIVHGEVRWLKEMFDVEMLVVNNSMTDILEDLVATLSLPEGLSLAAMKDYEQTFRHEIGTIAEGESKSTHWYVRGDKAGSYGLEALLEGTVMPFEEEIHDVFKSSDNLHVWAGDALNLNFEFPNTAYYGEDYPITITLENVSDIPLYNVHHGIFVTQGMEIYYHNGKEKKKIEISEWESVGVDVFNPGDKLIIETNINIFFDSEAMEQMKQGMIGMVDYLEQMLNAIDAVNIIGNLCTGFVNAVKGAASALSLEKSILGQIKDESILKATKELYSSIGGFYKQFSSSGDKTIDTGSKLLDTGITEILDMMSSDSVLDYILSKKPEDILSMAKQIQSFTNSFESQEEAASREFDLFDSIRTAISAIPVCYVLSGVVMKDDFASNTTKIPWTYTVTEAGPQYFGVSDVSKYLYSIIQAAMGQFVEEQLPWYSLIPGVDEPLNYKDAIAYIQATENEIAAFKAKDATGEVSFNAYYVPNTKTRSLRGTTEDTYTLECNNKNAVYENGVLSFAGDSMIYLTPKGTDGGTLYIEDSEGNTYTYCINVVEQHECIEKEREILVAPTVDRSGYAVECCEICDQIMKIEEISCCEEHVYSEWSNDIEASCTEYGMKTRCCTCCGFSETEFVGEIGHTDIKLINVVEASCTKKGYTGDAYCNICNTVIKVGETIEAKGHSHTSNVIYPSCTKKGYTTYTCSECGDTYTVDETAALGHNMSNFEVIKQPTCTDKGTEKADCSRCSYYETREIAAIGHNYGDDNICDNCGDGENDDCSCNCHKTGFMSFIWKILRFFYKLFKTNKVCSCGVAHY